LNQTEALIFRFDAFSSREPVSTSLEDAIARPRQVRRLLLTKTRWNRSNLNSRSGFSCDFGGTFRLLVKFNPHSMEEDEMRKLGYVIAALGAIAVAAPSIASAETVVVKHRDHGWHHRDYGWHRDHGWRHHDKMVVVKHRHEG
jgi:hypothetical protein